MKKKESSLPAVWRQFGHFPSLFEDMDEWFPQSMTFSNEQGLSVSEDQKTILVEAAVPGLKPDNIEISLDQGTIWIKGQQAEEEKDKERSYYRKASRLYSYCTSLPESADLSQEPVATYEDGILKVVFSKKESSKPKRIEIKKK